METLADAAVDLARRGLHVFPMVPRTKRPAIAGGHHSSSADEATVADWWRKNPEGNIGINLDASGVVVVDIDDFGAIDQWPHELRAIAESHDGPCVMSRAGKAHFWFRASADRIGRRVRIYPGVDILGRGYIVAPPSIHPDTGEPYRWVNDLEHELPELPEVLTLACLAAPAEEEREPVTFGGLADGEGRNEQAARIIGHGIARHLEPDAVWLLAKGWNTTNRPPLADSELRKVFDSIMRTDAKAHPDRDGARDALRALDASIASKGTIEDGFTTTSVYDMTDVDLVPVIEDMLHTKETCILYGQPGTCKTFVVLDICLRMIHGMPWGDKDLRAGDVLYFAGEGRHGFRRRVQAWHQGHHVPIGSAQHRLMVSDLPGIVDGAARVMFRKTVLRQPWSLVVIDTLSCAFGSAVDENKADEVNRLIELLKEVREESDTAFLVIHHAAKGSQGGTQGMRGSSAMSGNTEATLSLTRKGDTIEIEVAKVKDGPSHYTVPVEFRSVELGTKPNGKPLTSGYVSLLLVDEMTREFVAAIARSGVEQFSRGALRSIVGDNSVRIERCLGLAMRHQLIVRSAGTSQGTKLLYELTDAGRRLGGDRENPPNIDERDHAQPDDE